MNELTRAFFENLDQSDPLRTFPDRFSLPAGTTYLNGNSLGALPRSAATRARQVIEEEWGKGLIKSWNNAGWFRSPERIGNKIAKLIGAGENEVLCTDATGINLFKVLAAALQLRPERRVIIMEGSNFPTDNYVTQGLIKLLHDKHEIRFVEKNEIMGTINKDTAVVCLTQVHYKYGHILDMKHITQQAHAMGALAVWDLCHSTGAIPVNLNDAGVDFAIGCTYKYLNGGPGGPAYLFAAKRHHGRTMQPLTGWWSHANPFAFTRDYEPANNIGQMQSGTQPIISMAIAETGIDIMLEVDMTLAREKSMRMGTLFIQLLEEKCPFHEFTIASPLDSEQRGSHVALEHEHGYSIMQALIDRNVIGDYREPRIMRFSFAPVYNRYIDIWNAVETLSAIMDNETWRQEAYKTRHTVT